MENTIDKKTYYSWQGLKQLLIDLNFTLHLSSYVPSIAYADRAATEFNDFLRAHDIPVRTDSIEELLHLYYSGKNPEFNTLLDFLPTTLPYERVSWKTLIPELSSVFKAQFGQTQAMSEASAELAESILQNMATRAGTTPEQLSGLVEFFPLDSPQNAFSDLTVEDYQKHLVDGFYSSLSLAISSKKSDHSAKKWLEILGKSDEMVYTGLREFLENKDPGEIITKNDLLLFLEKNRLTISIVTHYSQLPTCTMSEAIKAAKLGEVICVVPSHGKENSVDLSQIYPIHLDDINDPSLTYCYASILDDYLKNTAHEPLYEAYTSPGEYRDYKEILVSYIPPDSHKISYANSSHYPKESNIVLHLRTSIRETEDGKRVFYIEELQSDWAQTGRKNGFDNEISYNEMNNLFDRREQLLSHISESLYNKKLSALRHDEYSAVLSKLPPDAFTAKEQDYLTRYSRDGALSNPFSGPFVSNTATWVKLGLKVALQHAVKSNADCIAWADGQTQNITYSFAKNAERVTIQHNTSNNTYTITPYIRSENGSPHQFKSTTIHEHKLSDVLGKNMFHELSDPTVSGNYIVAKNESVITYDFDIKNALLYNTGLLDFYGNTSSENHGFIGNVAHALFHADTKVFNLKISSPSQQVQNYEHAKELLTPDENGTIIPIDFFTEDTSTGERYWTSYEDLDDFLSAYETEDDYLEALTTDVVFYYTPVEKESRIYLTSYDAIIEQLLLERPVVFPDETITSYNNFIARYPTEQAFYLHIATIPEFCAYYVDQNPKQKVSCYGMEITDKMRDQVHAGLPLFQIVGEKGLQHIKHASGILDNLAVAKKMLHQDASDLVIRLATGWELVGEKWRYEIDDAECKILGKFNEHNKILHPQGTKLYDAVDYPFLYKLYPGLRNKTCFISISPDNRGIESGQYSPENNSFSIVATSKKQARQFLLHELQHYIQSKEGFASGGAPSLRVSYSDYLNLPGEIESRNVELRHKYPFLKSVPIKDTEHLVLDRINGFSIDAISSAYLTSLIARGEQLLSPKIVSAATRFISDTHAIITAGTSPKITAPLHELAHVYEKYLSQKEIQVIEKWSGFKYGTREFSERFAEGCERYIYDAKAPKLLQPVFEQFKKWIEKTVDLLHHIKNIPPLNTDMKKIYDTMFAKNAPPFLAREF